MRRFILCLVCLLCAIGIVSQSVAQESETLTIFAAASLTDSFTELGEAFAETRDVELVFNFASSSTLASQIIEGAEADIFASANLSQMNLLLESGLLDEETVEIFAENILVIIVPVDNPAGIESAEDLARNELLLVLASPDVPIREYSEELLNNLMPLYGDDYPDSVLSNLVSEEANVRQVVARVALGEADAGIVYRSDVTPDVAEDLLIIPVPDGASPIASYPIAMLSDNPQAEAFMDYLLSDEGQAVMQSWGFCSPEKEEAEMTPEVTPEMTPEATPEANATC